MLTFSCLDETKIKLWRHKYFTVLLVARIEAGSWRNVELRKIKLNINHGVTSIRYLWRHTCLLFTFPVVVWIKPNVDYDIISICLPSVGLFELPEDELEVGPRRRKHLSRFSRGEGSPVILDRRCLFSKPFRDEPPKSGNPVFIYYWYDNLF